MSMILYLKLVDDRLIDVFFMADLVMTTRE